MKAALLVLSLVSAPLLAQEKPVPPMAALVQAADKGDAAGMMAALGKGELPKQIEGCYLRRVYGNPAGGAIAAWMCADGEKASRVVLGEVGQSGDKALLRIVRETRNQVPAPPREGPALAPDPSPETPK